MTTRGRRRFAAGAFALALVISACSSTDDGTSADVTAGPEAAGTPEPTETPDATPAETAPSDEPTAEPAPTDGADTEAAVPDVVVPEALRFTAPLVGGGEFDGAAYADKPTVFWFWAPT